MSTPAKDPRRIMQLQESASTELHNQRRNALASQPGSNAKARDLSTKMHQLFQELQGEENRNDLVAVATTFNHVSATALDEAGGYNPEVDLAILYTNLRAGMVDRVDEAADAIATELATQFLALFPNETMEAVALQDFINSAIAKITKAPRRQRDPTSTRVHEVVDSSEEGTVETESEEEDTVSEATDGVQVDSDGVQVDSDGVQVDTESVEDESDDDNAEDATSHRVTLSNAIEALNKCDLALNPATGFNIEWVTAQRDTLFRHLVGMQFVTTRHRNRPSKYQTLTISDAANATHMLFNMLGNRGATHFAATVADLADPSLIDACTRDKAEHLSFQYRKTREAAVIFTIWKQIGDVGAKDGVNNIRQGTNAEVTRFIVGCAELFERVGAAVRAYKKNHSDPSTLAGMIYADTQPHVRRYKAERVVRHWFAAAFGKDVAWVDRNLRYALVFARISRISPGLLLVANKDTIAWIARIGSTKCDAALYEFAKMDAAGVYQDAFDIMATHIYPLWTQCFADMDTTEYVKAPSVAFPTLAIKKVVFAGTVNLRSWGELFQQITDAYGRSDASETDEIMKDD